jgi:phosphoserine phosphatase
MGITNANEKLGLPTDEMKKIVICFDVDGTLRNNTQLEPQANERIRTLLITLASFKNTKIIVWSGSGELYARQVARAIHVDAYVDGYASKTAWKEIIPDIAIDDIQDTAIGQINLIVREK